jgi:hypothetical protein
MKGQRFALERLQQLADQHAFTKHSVLIEDQRCQRDLLYALFQRPSTVLEKLLPGMLAIVAKKNAPDMESSRIFRDARSYLLEPNKHADEHIRVFVILLIINRDTEVHAIFKNGYLDGNMWGDAKAGCAQFDRFLIHLAQLVDGLFNAPFGESNVTQRVFELVVGSKIFYLSK